MTNSIDLKFNYPTVEEELIITNKYLQRFLSKQNKNLFSFPPYQGDMEVLRFASKWLGLSERFAEAATLGIVTCNSGNQALSCILQVLRENDSIIITDPFTYPAFKAIASKSGYRLKPCASDSDGITLEGLKEVFSETGSKLLYLQPTIHNPTCAVMPIQRRNEISQFAVENNILIVEDDAYRFLCRNPPPRFLDLIPENTFHIYSLSKPFNAFIKTAFLITPSYFKEKIVDCIRLSSSGGSSLLCDFAGYLMQTESLQSVIKQKQDLAEQLQKLAAQMLEGFDFRTFPTSFHIWLRLPKNLKATRLVNTLAIQNISVASGTDFATGELTDGEHFIRISLGAEKNNENLKKGLRAIVSLLTARRAI